MIVTHLLCLIYSIKKIKSSVNFDLINKHIVLASLFSFYFLWWFYPWINNNTRDSSCSVKNFLIPWIHQYHLCSLKRKVVSINQIKRQYEFIYRVRFSALDWQWYWRLNTTNFAFQCIFIWKIIQCDEYIIIRIEELHLSLSEFYFHMLVVVWMRSTIHYKWFWYIE